MDKTSRCQNCRWAKVSSHNSYYGGWHSHIIGCEKQHSIEDEKCEDYSIPVNEREEDR